ncbi:hypothetical protein [Anaerorhabdus sp.]|uniref:hypothetical protein n=1 Tax=Anaerorhabdus sp. TaxID=1872524 RepID=UPI002FC6BEF5
MKDLINHILDSSDSEYNGLVVKILKLAIAISIFISPAFIFLILYKKDLILKYNLYIIFLIILISSCLLFVVSYMCTYYLSSLNLSKLNAEKDLSEEDRFKKISQEVIITNSILSLYAMLILTLFLISYYIFNYMNLYKSPFKDGINIILIFIAALSVLFLITRYKFKSKLEPTQEDYKEKYNKLKDKLEELKNKNEI